MNKHTPKPWLAGTDPDAFNIEINRGNNLIAVVVYCDTREERMANARLIAAAPELLKALEQMVAAFNVKEIDPLVAFLTIEKAQATIQKATT